MEFNSNISQLVSGQVLTDDEGNKRYLLPSGGTIAISENALRTLNDPTLTIAQIVEQYIRVMSIIDNQYRVGLQRLNDLTALKGHVSDDRDTLSDALWEKFDDLGISSKAFDKWVEDLNQSLNVVTLKKRMRRWLVSLRYSVTLEHDEYVDAMNETEAEEKACEAWTEDDIITQLRDEIDSSEVEVQSAEEDDCWSSFHHHRVVRTSAANAGVMLSMS